MSSIFLHEKSGMHAYSLRSLSLTVYSFLHQTNLNRASDVLTDFFRVLPGAVEYSASVSSSAVVPRLFCRWDDLAVLKAAVEVRSRLFFSGLRLEDCELQTDTHTHRVTDTYTVYVRIRCSYKLAYNTKLHSVDLAQGACNTAPLTSPASSRLTADSHSPAFPLWIPP